MIKITLPDNAVKSVDLNTSPLQIASSISKSLAECAIAAIADGKCIDLNTSLQQDCKLEIIKKDHPLSLEIIRHDAAHLLAQAVLELYPSAKLGVGPVIEDGFYYDIACQETISVCDLEEIENKMQELAKAKYRIKRQE